MRKSDVLKHFETLDAVATVLNISRAAVSQWPERVPERSAWRLQFLTGGRLQVDQTMYPRRGSAVP